jgi:simple sugar transport system permease protein
MYVAVGLRFDKFFSLRVFFNLFSDNAFLGVIAIGTTFVILTGGIDLSIGSMMGCASIMAASLMQNGHWPAFAALAAALAFGALVGWCQGALVAFFRLPSFLITLAGLFFCRGVALRISQESVQIDNPLFNTLAGFQIQLPGRASITATSIVLFLVVIVCMFVARQTRFGRTIYAIGGSMASAELMGLKVRRTLIGAYTLSGLCAALGGAVFTLYTSSGDAISGTGL